MEEAAEAAAGAGYHDPSQQVLGADERRRLEATVGYVVCGINGCCLQYGHCGECLFELNGRRCRQRPTAPAPPVKRRRTSAAGQPSTSDQSGDAPLAAEAAQPAPEPPPAAPRLADVSVYERGAGWRKPVDTPCAECGGCHDPTQTLLCDGDGCDRAYHLSCLKPPLEHVPAGKWLCPGCTERWNASEAGSRELARSLYEQEMREARNLRR